MHWYDTVVADAKARHLSLFRILLVIFFLAGLALGFSVAHFVNTILGLLILILLLPFLPQLVGALTLALLLPRRQA